MRLLLICSALSFLQHDAVEANGQPPGLVPPLVRERLAAKSRAKATLTAPPKRRLSTIIDRIPLPASSPRPLPALSRKPSPPHSVNRTIPSLDPSPRTPMIKSQPTVKNIPRRPVTTSAPRRAVPANISTTTELRPLVTAPALKSVLFFVEVHEGRQIWRTGNLTSTRSKREVVVSSGKGDHQYVSKDGSTVITTSSTDDMLVIVQSTSPITHSVISSAGRKIQKVYEEALNDVQETFNEIGNELTTKFPDREDNFQKAKGALSEKMNELKKNGNAVRKDAMRKAVEQAAQTPDGEAAQMKQTLGQYLVYDNAIMTADGLLYSWPVMYQILDQSSQPVKTAAQGMQKAVSDYVGQTMNGMRSQFAPLSNTITELEKKLQQELNELTSKTVDKITGMMSYETLDAVNDLGDKDMQSISVVQTGPGFSYVTLQTASPALSQAVNGTAERAKTALQEYQQQLQPFIDGAYMPSSIFQHAPKNDEQAKSVKELLNKLGKEVEDYLKNGEAKAATEAAKAVKSSPEGKEKLDEAVQNATVYYTVPMLYNGWYTYAPTTFVQASNLATSTTVQLQTLLNNAANYAYALLADVFGQLYMAALPLQKAAEKMGKGGEKIGEKVQQTLPFAIAQATTEMPKDKKQNLQQLIYLYYYPVSMPLFGR